MTGQTFQRGGISETETESVGGGGLIHKVSGRSNQEQTAIAVFTTKVRIVNPTGIVEVDDQPIKVYVYFDRKMKYNYFLLDSASYSIVPTTGGIVVDVLSVEPENTTDPQYVVLSTTEFTSYSFYDLAVLGPTGFVDNAPMDLSEGPTTIYSLLGNPTIESVVAESKNSVAITFSEGMLKNDMILDPDNYVFDPVLQVNSVQYIDSNKILLITDDQTPGELYTLEITAEPEAPPPGP